MKRTNKWQLTILVLALGLILSSCQQKTKKKDFKTLARQIHDRVLTVDTHADTPSNMRRGNWDVGQYHQPGQRKSGQVDLPRMKEGGLDALFFAVFVGQGDRTPEGYAQAQKRAARELDAIDKMVKGYPDLVELATTPEDAYRLQRQGKRAAFIGLENGYPIDEDLAMVKKYYDRGVRYITLCHSHDNDICDSSTDRENPEDNGLSDFGRQVVAECNRLGIMVDVSHLSDKSFFDVLKVTKAPVIASHSSVRALCDHPRNLSDEMLKALASNGGVIQICFVSSFIKKPKPNPARRKALAELRKKYGPWRLIKDEATLKKLEEEYQKINEEFPEEKATLKELVDHIDYVVKLIGIDHVGIGTDFDGGGGVEGCDDVTQLPRVTEELLRRGYSKEDIRKIWGGNLMRVFSQVIEVAQEIQKSEKKTISLP